MTPAAPPLEAFVAALPKVDLHLHLVGSVPPAAVLALARRHPGRGVPARPDALARYLSFGDLAGFCRVYGAVSRLLDSGADVLTLVLGLAAELARRRVRWAEVTVTPGHLVDRIPAPVLAEALTEGGRQARDRHGVQLGWVVDVDGEQGPDGAAVALDFALRHRPEGTVAFRLGGPEAGVPREWFAGVFRAARAAGLRSVPHAGETGDPRAVWAAVHQLGADRVGHGIGAAADPRLLDHLACTGTVLEVCPTSNLRTGVVRSIDRHPLPRLLDAGVPVVLGTDDPGLFGTDLDAEYLLCARSLGVDRPALAALARTSVHAASCPDHLRAELLADLAQALSIGDAPGLSRH